MPRSSPLSKKIGLANAMRGRIRRRAEARNPANFNAAKRIAMREGHELASSASPRRGASQRVRQRRQDALFAAIPGRAHPRFPRYCRPERRSLTIAVAPKVARLLRYEIHACPVNSLGFADLLTRSAMPASVLNRSSTRARSALTVRSPASVSTRRPVVSVRRSASAVSQP
jgi:hypothetical protein